MRPEKELESLNKKFDLETRFFAERINHLEVSILNLERALIAANERIGLLESRIRWVELLKSFLWKRKRKKRSDLGSRSALTLPNFFATVAAGYMLGLFVYGLFLKPENLYFRLDDLALLAMICISVSLFVLVTIAHAIKWHGS